MSLPCEQDRQQACPCCSALPTPHPHRSRSRWIVATLASNALPNAATAPPRRSARHTSMPPGLSHSAYTPNQTFCSQTVHFAHTVPQQSVYPRAFTQLSCTRAVNLHSPAQCSPTNCIPTHPFAHRDAPSQVRACTRPVHLFEAQRSCSNVLRGAAHNKTLRCCTHPALRPTNAAFRAATARGSLHTPALTVGVHPASSNERAECDCHGRPWRWLHPIYQPPRVVSFSRSRRQCHPQLVVGLRHRLTCSRCTFAQSSGIGQLPHTQRNPGNLRTYEPLYGGDSTVVAPMRQFVGWCDDVAVCTRSRMPFTRRRSRGYFRDSSTGAVGIFATPQRACRDMSRFLHP